MTADVRLELLQLLSGLCDGELSEAHEQRLQELLQAGPECRRLYLEYVDMHARLLSHPVCVAQADSLPRDAASGEPARATSQAASWKKYGFVAAATLAASLLVQLFFSQSRPPRADDAVPAANAVPALLNYVATLTQSAGCVWEKPNESLWVGARLMPGELRLRQGLARIDFDNGPNLVVEAPAVLRLESTTAATLYRGKVFFKADETAPPFDLHTPSSTLVDLGTEYAVAVNSEAEEVYVFKGEVQRKPKALSGAGALENLKAGQARRYGTASSGEPIPLDPTRFVREVAPPDQAPDLSAGLLAYEGFDYKDHDDLRTGHAQGGFGWVGAWVPFLIRPLNPLDSKQQVFNARESLVRPGAAVPSVGGCFDYTGFTKFYRRLRVPIRLDTDGVYYFSFLFRRYGPPADEINAVALLLWTDADYRDKTEGNSRERLNFGVRGVNELFTSLQPMSLRTPLPLNYGETYLLVAKVVAGAVNPDQVFLRVYGAGELVENAEPASWSAISSPFHSELVFDWCQLHINSRTRQLIDEVRLGTAWSAVTAPWLGRRR